MSINELFAKYNFNINGKIEKVEVNTKMRALRIKLKPDGEISDKDIFSMQKLLMQAYGLEKVLIEQTDKPEVSNVEQPGKKEPAMVQAATEEKKEPAENKKELSDYEKFIQEKEREADERYKEAKKDPHIMGKKITKKTITPMSEISEMTANVVICGKLNAIEVKEVRGGRNIVTFDMYDGSGSVTCKIIFDSSSGESVISRLKKGSWYRVKGSGLYDKYARDIMFMANDIEEAEAPEEKKDDAEVKRVELHLHTQMSSMDAMTSAGDLIKRAIKWGHKAIAITDHGVVQAFPEAMSAAKGAEDFKVLYGVEGYLVDKFEFPAGGKPPRPYHVVIFAKNQEGLKNLYAIISESHMKYFYKRPRIPKELLARYREGLIVGSACEQGELYQAILEKKSDEEIEKIASLYDYYEVQPLGNNRFMINNGTVKNEQELIDINKKIIDLADRHGKLVVATGDVHFMDPEDSIFRAIIQTGQGYTDADNQAPLYMRTTQEMLDEFKYLDDETAYRIVVENTNKIADMVDKLLPIPNGTYPPQMEGAQEQIVQMCHEKAHRIYGDPLPDIVRERMERELEKIIKYGFSVMYMIANKLVTKSLSDGYVVGSRGSVGSSFVAFLCDITEVNGLAPHYVCPNCKHSEFITDGSVGCGPDMEDKQCPVCGTMYKKDGYDIPFETFLGFEGDKEPDIDLNFSGEYQGTAHKYVEELFGEGYVFKAGTIGTLADKTAYGYVKKYLEEHGKLVHNAEINRLVSGCVGVKRTTGQHPGGLMILPKGHDIHEFCPVQFPADDKSKNVITTHFDYHSISGRLLKLDILGHDNPTIIRMLEDITGVKPSTVPLGDPETMSIFSDTQALGVTPEQIGSQVGTFGIPEFGTNFVRNMLVETEPTTLSELVRISGLSHGTNVWTNNAQDLVRAGTITLKDAICTRDDIMLELIQWGLPKKESFTIMERVRKGKKLTPEFEALMREHKVPEWYIESCNKIQYMFPKAHAVAYVTLAVQIAYFKVHYPEAFYRAYLTVHTDEFDISIMGDRNRVRNEIKRMENSETGLNAKEKATLTVLQVVNEMYERGLKFSDVDINRSQAKRFGKCEDGILPPLMAVSGLGESVAYAIVQEREKEPFDTIEDLRYRTKLNKTVSDFMKEQGYLGDMPEDNQISLFDL